MLEPALALVHLEHDRVQPIGLQPGQVRGDLVLRAQVAGQLADDPGPAAQLGLELAQVSQGIGDVGIVVAGPVAMGDRLQHRQVAGALEVIDVQLGPHIQGGGQQQQPRREGLAHPGDGADHHRGEHEGERDGPAALVGPEGERGEQVDRPRLGQRPGRLTSLGHVLVADPQDQAAGMHLGVALGPHAPQGAAQAGGELVAPIRHLPHGHPGREVEVGPPAGAVAVDRRDEPDGLGVSGQGLVDPGQAEHAQGPDHHLAGEAGRPRDDHGPLEQRPIRWRPGHAQGGDQQGQWRTSGRPEERPAA